MQMKKPLIPFLVTILICFFYSPLFAEFAIQLKNGGILTASKVWEENGTINFLWQGGMASFPKESIASIQEVKESPPKRIFATPKADNKMNEPVSPVPQNKKLEQQSVIEIVAPDQEKANVEAFQKEKAIYAEKFEEAHKRYLEACSQRDEEAKKKAWEEFTRFAGQVSQITEELEKRESKKNDQEQK
jgi:hypothetical protein